MSVSRPGSHWTPSLLDVVRLVGGLNRSYRYALTQIPCKPRAVTVLVLLVSSDTFRLINSEADSESWHGVSLISSSLHYLHDGSILISIGKSATCSTSR